MVNVLLLCDDMWHPGEVLERGLKPLAAKDVNIDAVKAPKDILTHDMIREYDVIICARSNSHSAYNPSAPWFEPEVTAVMPSDFMDYIKEGGGFIALHSGSTYSRQRLPEMAEITGNDFKGHPKQCMVKAVPEGDHPIVNGVKETCFKDEHYMIEVHADDIDVFLKTTSDSPAGTQIAGYTRNIGEGRFCCLTPGHNCAVLLDEQFSKIIYNAILWCAKKI